MIDPRDEGEVAQEYQAKLNAAAIATHRAKMTSNISAPSLEICEDCEEKIPAERRKKQPGCTRCVACQSLYERIRGGM